MAIGHSGRQNSCCVSDRIPFTVELQLMLGVMNGVSLSFLVTPIADARRVSSR